MKYITDLSNKVSSKLNVSQTILKAATIISILLLVISIVWGIRSCSSADYSFKTKEDAINCFHTYLSEVRKTEAFDVKSCSSEINKWLEVRDTVINYLAKDSTFSTDSKEFKELEYINDSIRHEFIRLSETWKCSFSDIVAIKESTSPFKSDEEILAAVHDATPFFVRLDSVEIHNVSKEDAIDDYRLFLVQWARKGVISDEDMLKYISNEDIYFRTFLAHLYELDGEHISDITHLTEGICTRIFREARKGNITPKSALTYMSMRTVRRLLQNSTVCVNDIKHRKMKSEMQANAYLWMIIQPFMSIDPFAIATITPEGRQNFKYIAEQLPKSTSFSKAFNIDQRALNYLLPQQLLKMYIQTL